MQEHVQRQSGRSMRVGPTLMSKGSSVCVSLAQLGVCRRMRGLPRIPGMVSSLLGLGKETASCAQTQDKSQAAAPLVQELACPGHSRFGRDFSGIFMVSE